jgi:predicted component of viral defense system (DUF524 family)
MLKTKTIFNFNFDWKLVFYSKVKLILTFSLIEHWVYLWLINSFDKLKIEKLTKSQIAIEIKNNRVLYENKTVYLLKKIKWNLISIIKI